MIKLADKASIPRVIAEMTVEEKVHAICSPGPVRYIVERLGIPAYTRADGHNGINMMQIMGRLPPGEGESAPPPANPEGGFALYGLLGEEGLTRLLRGQLEPEALDKLPPPLRAAATALAEKVRAWLPEGGLPTCFPPGRDRPDVWADGAVCARYADRRDV